MIIVSKSNEKIKYINSLKRYALLILDDLGAERKSEYMQEQVYNIIDARYKSGLPMIITTNLTAEEMKKPSDLGNSRIYDRILERMMISTLYSLGVRRSELIGLRVGDVDFGRNLVKVRGKGDKMREIPLVASLSQEILLYLKRIKGEFPEGTDAMFFVTDKGKAVYPGFVDKVVKEELGGLEGFSGRKSPHVLRHSIATHLMNHGADLNSIKEMLGHSSLAATQVYTHTSFEQLKNTFLTAHPRAKKRR